jgi:type I restriction enzyme, S subunit
MTALRDFEDVLTDVTGGNIKTLQSDFSPAGQFPIVDQGKELIAGFTDDESRVCRADLPVVVFGDHTKCFKFIDFPFCLGADGTKVLRPSNGDDPKYLFHYLRQIKLTDAGYSRHYKYLKEIKIPLPPLAEQRRIAAILDAADALRQQRRQALCLLDQLSQSIFLDMFGEDRPHSRRPLSAVCELITDGTHYTPTYADHGVTFLSAKNVTSGRINWSEIKYIPETLHLELQRRVSPRRDDVLLAKNGTTGVAAIVDRDDVFDIYVSLALLRSGAEIRPQYLLHCINSGEATKQFRGALKGIGVSNLHLVDIRAATIPVPSLALQDKFIERIQKLDKLRELAQHSLTNLDTLFAALQHRAFRGEL